MRPGLIATGALLLAACAGGTSQAGPETATPCMLSGADSAYLAAGPVYRDCHVDRPAQLRPGSGRFEISSTNPPAMRSGCLTATVEFVVLPDGSIERGTERLVRASQPEFGRAVLEAVPSWRYEPALLNGVAVRQVVSEERKMAWRITRVGPGGLSSRTTPPRC